jgi:hypothetical protein
MANYNVTSSVYLKIIRERKIQGAANPFVTRAKKEFERYLIFFFNYKKNLLKSCAMVIDKQISKQLNHYRFAEPDNNVVICSALMTFPVDKG